MDIRKFDDLLNRSALYFSRPDKFVDPFEGRLSPGNAAMLPDFEAAFHAAYRIAPAGNDMEASREIMRRCVFISCWHRNKAENREMWDAYTSNAESVAISSSAKALYSFVTGLIQKSTVKYHDDDFPRSEFGHTTLFFYKPKRYSFEREFRMLLAPGENESIRLDEVGRHVRINLKKIVHRVITHPRASAEFKATVDSLLRQHLKSIGREDSRLLP